MRLRVVGLTAVSSGYMTATPIIWRDERTRLFWSISSGVPQAAKEILKKSNMPTQEARYQLTGPKCYLALLPPKHRSRLEAVYKL